MITTIVICLNCLFFILLVINNFNPKISTGKDWLDIIMAVVLIISTILSFIALFQIIF